jgi:cytochrome P450
MIRSVITRTRIGRHRVRPGDRIILSTVMACQRAGDFNPFRPIPKDMRQLWFGAGAHFCIGMPLAMLEATTFASTIASVSAVRSLRIVSKTYKTNTIAASYSELVIQCTPS